MPVFCCGFNEFGQVSSADSDRQHGFVPLPMLIDLQSNIRKQDEASGNAAAAGVVRVLSVGVSWSRILYVTDDGHLSVFGDVVDNTEPAMSLATQQCLQSLVESVSCSWRWTCIVSRGVCYVYDNHQSVTSMCCPHCVIATSQTTSDQHILVIPPDDTSTDSHSLVDSISSVSTSVAAAAAAGPSVLLSEEHIASVETNDTHTLAVTSQRSLLSVNMGHQSSLKVDRPWSIYRCASVSCGHAHALVLSVIGVVFSCGHGSQGQLGHGGLESESSLRMVEALEGLTMTCVAAGGWHSAATSDSGDVYVWGWNDQGQLGLQSHLQTDDNEADSAEVKVVTLPHVLDLPLTSRDLDLSLTSDDLCVVKLACGSRHSLAVTSHGHAYSWGANDYGQLGHGDLVSRNCPTVVGCFVEQNLRVVDVFAGYWNSVFITDSLGLLQDS